MKAAFFNVKKQFSHPVSGRGASGKTNPHSTKVLPSGHRHKRKRSSFRHESRSTFSFSLYRACARRRVSERNRAKRGSWRGDRHVSFLFQEEKKCGAQSFLSLPRRKNTPLWDATVPPSSNKAKNTPLRGAAVPPCQE